MNIFSPKIFSYVVKIYGLLFSSLKKTKKCQVSVDVKITSSQNVPSNNQCFAASKCSLLKLLIHVIHVIARENNLIQV